MTVETKFEDMVPFYPDDEVSRGVELKQLLDIPVDSGTREEGPTGAWRTTQGRGLLFSAPHEAAQVREGAEKAAEKGTGQLAFALAHATGGSAIATTGRQSGDPSWDIGQAYVDRAQSLAADCITIDLHMMRPRGVEICIGLGPEPKLIEGLWMPFMQEAVENGLRVSVNWPFAASSRTITGQLQSRGFRALQLELSWDCYDPSHPAMARAWSSLVRAVRQLSP